MAGLSDADQGGFPVPRFDSGGADRARFGPLPRSGETRGHARDSGMAELLLQITDVRAAALSRARFVHSAHEAEEHAALDDGRRTDHAPGRGVLRLAKNRSNDESS